LGLTGWEEQAPVAPLPSDWPRELEALVDEEDLRGLWGEAT
jgi:hypothetical protein